MSGLFGGGSSSTTTVQQVPPTPALNQAVQNRMSENQNLVARGRATTVLTSQNGLPNLGQTTSPSATGN